MRLSVAEGCYTPKPSVSPSPDSDDTGTTVSTGMAGVLVIDFTKTYHWWAKYSGNSLNNAKEKGCGSETTSITITHVSQ